MILPTLHSRLGLQPGLQTETPSENMSSDVISSVKLNFSVSLMMMMILYMSQVRSITNQMIVYDTQTLLLMDLELSLLMSQEHMQIFVLHVQKHEGDMI